MGIVLYLAACALTVAFISVLRLHVEVEYSKKGRDDRLQVRVTALRKIISFKVEVPVVEWLFLEGGPGVRFSTAWEHTPGPEGGRKVKEEIPVPKLPERLPPLRRIVSIVLQVVRINSWLFGKINCTRFSWKTRLACGDAALTGIGGGLLWGLKGWMMGNIHRNVNMLDTRAEINVFPEFEGQGLVTEFHCIFNLRVGYIIIAGIRFLFVGIITYILMRGARTHERSSN